MKKRLLFLPALALFFGGCSAIPFLNKTAETVTQTAEEKMVQQEILKNCTYDKAICEYMAAQMSAFQSGLTMTSSTVTKGKASTITSVTKIDGNGNMESVSSENGKEMSAMIVFNKDSYIKDYEDNTWMKMTTSDDGEETSLFDIPTTAEDMKEAIEKEENATEYTKVGQEPCGDMAPGLTCDVYEVKEKGSEDSSTKMWIDTSKHLSRKMEMSISSDAVNTIVYTYGAVSISEPSPVKEFTMPTLPTGAGSMPSQADIEKMMQDLPDYGQDEGSEE